MKKLLIIPAAALFLFASCASDNKSGETVTETDTMTTTTTTVSTPAPVTENDPNAITGKNWKLITLEGKTVTMAKNQEREAFFMLNPQDKTVTGFAGCNTFSGSYALEEGQRIRFSQVGATMMACPDVKVNEGAFMEVFKQADNYTVYNDTLSLNVGRRAPLAMFTVMKAQ